MTTGTLPPPTPTPPSPSLPTPSPPTISRRLRGLAAARVAGLPAWVVLVQLFIGLGWLRAATEKAIDAGWWRGDGVTSFLADHDALTFGWYEPFVDVVVSPHVILIGAVVMAAQFVAGLSLLSGRHVAVGLAVGIFLNLNFVAAGAVNPSAFYLLGQGALALWMAERTRARHHTSCLLTGTSVGATAIAARSVPYVTTLHPAQVIEDPAVMLVLCGVLTVLVCALADRSISTAHHPSPPLRSGTQSRCPGTDSGCQNGVCGPDVRVSRR
jgi:thiosulfate dehydrogenase [quinone] large subunit